MTTGIPPSTSQSSSVTSLLNANNAATPKTDIDEAQPNTAPVAERTASPSLEEVTQISDKLNESAQRVQRGLNFSVDDNQGDIVIKVIDQQTNELIRQIPSEDMLELSRSLEEVNSLLFNKIKA
jgi:flagellar protein FlaG